MALLDAIFPTATPRSRTRPEMRGRFRSAGFASGKTLGSEGKNPNTDTLLGVPTGVARRKRMARRFLVGKRVPHVNNTDSTESRMELYCLGEMRSTTLASWGCTHLLQMKAERTRFGRTITLSRLQHTAQRPHRPTALPEGEPTRHEGWRRDNATKRETMRARCGTRAARKPDADGAKEARTK